MVSRSMFVGGLVASAALASAIDAEDVVAQALAADREEACTSSESCESTNLLQVRAAATATQGEEQLANSTLAPELIHEVYTYGAPATHKTPWRNLARKDGCFLGLRAYTEDRFGTGHHIHQVDAAAMNNYYPHAQINTVVLHGNYDAYFAPCTGTNDEFGHPEWPQRGGSVYEEWRLHGESSYTQRLDSITVDGQDKTNEEPFRSSRLFVRLAYKSYDTLENQVKTLKEERPNWVLVERADDVHGKDVDPVMLVQEQGSLDCALIFTGTNAFSEFATSTTQYSTGYCGFRGVHVGYRDELWTLTKRVFPFMKPKLAKCRKVICVGHSLGGALCELFAACANSGHTTDPDYQMLAWTPGTPQRMPQATSIDFPPSKKR